MSIVSEIEVSSEDDEYTTHCKKAVLAEVIVTHLEETAPPPDIVEAYVKFFELTDIDPKLFWRLKHLNATARAHVERDQTANYMSAPWGKK